MKISMKETLGYIVNQVAVAGGNYSMQETKGAQLERVLNSVMWQVGTERDETTRLISTLVKHQYIDAKPNIIDGKKSYVLRLTKLGAEGQHRYLTQINEEDLPF